MSVVAYLLAAAVVVIGVVVWRLAGLGRERERRRLQTQAEAIRAASKAEASAAASAALARTKSNVLELERAAHAEASRIERELERREDELRRRADAVSARELKLMARAAALETREAARLGAEQRRAELDRDRRATEEQVREVLERAAGETRAEIRERMVQDWLEETKADAAERIRRAGEGAADGELGREAKRLMGIAIQRYHGHYLTERLLSNLPLPPGVGARLAGPTLAAIEEVSNVKLSVADDANSVRLEGQDSFGREIARRAIHRLGKNALRGDIQRATLLIKEELEREVFELGKRAFHELDIPRAHPDIVRLVGRLNWRTSYRQNQWKHAIEAAFLCGMMADELGLDVKLARRAALMHDIGKALTHEIDGSHAVIGAEYARRLGEHEAVANAIGAHHADEPCNTVYASLVAAADAMSGARPGARREQTDNYVQRLEDLERIGAQFEGVERAFAVHGGREVRIYVEESRVTDERAVEMSAEIARLISEQLTFPGQIKVTVIREVKATAVAG